MHIKPIVLPRISATLVLLAAAAAACILPPGDAQMARQTLISFFDDLSKGEYAQAAELYGGDYQQLQVFNPDIDASDRSALWQNGCQQSGLQCLPVASAALKAEAGGIYTFTVEFRKLDGNVFSLGPCCGSSATDMPPVSQFDVRVKETPQGKFLVLDLPPYMP